MLTNPMFETRAPLHIYLALISDIERLGASPNGKIGHIGFRHAVCWTEIGVESEKMRKNGS